MPIEAKVAFVGDSGVGKTSLISTFLSNQELSRRVEQTNLVDVYTKKVKVRDTNPNFFVRIQ